MDIGLKIINAMKYFLIKGFKGKTDDKFMMKATDDFILFVAFGLKDLENTLKGILPKGYRVRKPSTYSKRLKEHGSFQLLSMFNIPMVEVKEVDFKPLIKNTIDYYNKSRNSNHNIKTADPKYWDESKQYNFEKESF